MDESMLPPNVRIREFKSNLHHDMLAAMASDNPILAAIKNLPEFQEQFEEQEELLKIVNLRRKLSVADELVDATVEEIVEAAANLAGLFLANLTMSKMTGMRTVKIDTPDGHLQIVYTPPMGRGKR